MLRYGLSFLATGGAFLVLDMTWLTLMAPRLYRPRIGHLMAETTALGPAIAFYLVYLLAVLLLAVWPALKDGGWPSLWVRAAVFAAYATYDLTNQATLRDWSLTVTLVDLAWGTFATTVAASVGFWAARAVR
jgi:uncharacterized membrane protein